MYLKPESSDDSYKHGPQGNYGNYGVPSKDISASEAMSTIGDNSPSKALLEKFIKEVKFFTPRAGQSGPGGMSLIPDMKAEKMDPQHKFAGGGRDNAEDMQFAENLVLEFLAATEEKANAANFAKWLDTQDSLEASFVVKLIKTWNKDETVLERTPGYVKYLDMARRQRYVIEPGTDGIIYCRQPNDGSFKFERVPYHTGECTAAFMGRSGMAIWVQGPSGRFYSSLESQTGKFHHSSFLAGRQVKAAGDWKVMQGKLKVISAVSGHYHPSLDSLRGALVDLQTSSRQITSDAEVEMYKKPENTLVKMPVKDFLDNCSKNPKFLEGYKPVL